MQREKTLPISEHESHTFTNYTPSLRRPLIITGLFILFAFMSVVPLNRLAGTTQLASLPTNILLLKLGAILPTDLHLSPVTHASQVNTDSIEFLSLMLVLFLLYAKFALLLVQRIPYGYKKFQILIWVGAVLVGMIYVLTPSLLSRDAFVYAGYGRVIVTHHANPYYTPLSAFPHDPLSASDDWSNAIAAYGPLWLLICAVSTLVSGNITLAYLFFFRLLGLALHLCNIALVTAILKRWGHQQHIVLTGTLLYALNPLVLLESCLGAHNDTAMVTCILLGVLLTVRTEQDAFTHLPWLLAPVVAFVAAVLIKFTAAPLPAFYIVLVLTYKLRTHPSSTSSKAWQPAFFRGVLASLLAVTVIVTAYVPLWLHHSLKDIFGSIAAPPSSRLAFGSILLAVQKIAQQQQSPHVLLWFFSKHSVWNAINLGIMALLFVIGVIWLWRMPTTRTMLNASLASLGALLVVTPWFFPWYVIWLVALAACCISTEMSRIEKALVAAALTFSASALCIYLFRGYPPVGDWIGAICLTTIGPPILIFLGIVIAPFAHNILVRFRKKVHVS